MALVNEPALPGDHGERASGLAHQALRPLDTTLRDVALQTDPGCLLEGAAEMIGAQARHSGEIGQGQSKVGSFEDTTSLEFDCIDVARACELEILAPLYQILAKMRSARDF